LINEADGDVGSIRADETWIWPWEKGRRSGIGPPNETELRLTFLRFRAKKSLGRRPKSTNNSKQAMALHTHLTQLLSHGAAFGRNLVGYCITVTRSLVVGLLRGGFGERDQSVWRVRDLFKTRPTKATIYMITCPARSGSTMLVHLLRSHPDVCSHDEVFSPQKVTGITGTYLQRSRQQADFLDCLSAERNRDPVAFMYKVILDSQDKWAVGFKLKHDELVLPEYTQLREAIAGDLDFCIIHLWRENLLRRYLSHYVANHVTRVTLAVLNQPIPDVSAIRLDPVECERDFLMVESRQAELARLFGQHRGFSISYEEMVDGGSKKMAALQHFLGIRCRTLTTTTKKLGKHSLRKSIENFDELKEYFAGSGYSRFFEEP
jgi:hypothetical protein